MSGSDRNVSQDTAPKVARTKAEKAAEREEKRRAALTVRRRLKTDSDVVVLDILQMLGLAKAGPSGTPPRQWRANRKARMQAEAAVRKAEKAEKVAAS